MHFKKAIHQLLFNRFSMLSLVVLLPAHFFLARVSDAFTFTNSITFVWPSAGIFLAAVLLIGFRAWLPILIANLMVNQVLYYSSLPISLSIAAIDTAQVGLVSMMMFHYIKRPYPFDRVSNTLKYLFLLVPVPAVLSALAIAVQCAFGVSPWGDFMPLYQGWLCGDITAMVVVSPPFLCIWHSVKTGRWRLSKAQLAELSAVLAVLIIVGLIAFADAAPIEYLIILPLIWAAIRFGPREAACLTLAMSILAAFKTLRGHGSFAQTEVAQAAVLLQSFIVSLTIATLVLAAAVQENERANRSLKRANEELEDRVEERTQALSDTLRQLQKAQAHLVQQEKMSGLGQMVAGVAHEINNPVNFIHGNLRHVRNYARDLVDFLHLYEQYYPTPVEEIQVQLEELDIDFIKEDLEKTLSSMQVGTERIREIVLSLRNFSRMDEAESKPVDIHEGIESTLMILQHRLKASPERAAVNVVRDFGKLPLVECYAGQLNQVFMNILVNAIDAFENGSQGEDSKTPQITLRTERRDESVMISIADNGSGISEDIRARIFDPFFTTKPVGKGTGMGMAISYQLITEKHQGKIGCFSDLGIGTEFIIEIPLSLSAKARSQSGLCC